MEAQWDSLHYLCHISINFKLFQSKRHLSFHLHIQANLILNVQLKLRCKILLWANEHTLKKASQISPSISDLKGINFHKGCNSNSIFIIERASDFRHGAWAKKRKAFGSSPSITIFLTDLTTTGFQNDYDFEGQFSYVSQKVYFSDSRLGSPG